MNVLRRVLKALVPNGLIELRRALVTKRNASAAEMARTAFHEERMQRIDSVAKIQQTSAIRGDNTEQVLGFLANRGLPIHHLREGSVPPSSLAYIRDQVVDQFDTSRAIHALHIGNFVGVSLSYLTATIVNLHPESRTVSIDPNLTHRGVNNPQSHVAALLSACGLQSNTVIIAGYSGRKSISNDGVVFDGYDPQMEFSKEFACEESLRTLSILCPKTFDLVFLDGNHEAKYLLTEIQQVLPLLRAGGLVILDDVDTAWSEIRDGFDDIPSLGLHPLGSDGRVGIAKLSKNEASESRQSNK